jgi:hypothetical protein
VGLDGHRGGLAEIEPSIRPSAAFDLVGQGVEIVLVRPARKLLMLSEYTFRM